MRDADSATGNHRFQSALSVYQSWSQLSSLLSICRANRFYLSTLRTSAAFTGRTEQVVCPVFSFHSFQFNTLQSKLWSSELHLPPPPLLMKKSNIIGRNISSQSASPPKPKPADASAVSLPLDNVMTFELILMCVILENLIILLLHDQERLWRHQDLHWCCNKFAQQLQQWRTPGNDIFGLAGRSFMAFIMHKHSSITFECANSSCSNTTTGKL